MTFHKKQIFNSDIEVGFFHYKYFDSGFINSIFRSILINNNYVSGEYPIV